MNGGSGWSACRWAWRRPPDDHALFVRTSEDRTAAAGHSVDAEGWLAEFDTGFARIAGRFSRVEPRRQARSFLLGLLSDVDTRSCWQLAEQTGDSSPHAMQRLLGEAVWDADAVRDEVRGYVIDALGHRDGVLILDDTGDLKKGCPTVGVQRQYTRTAGRVENAQVAVYLAYAAPGGYTLVDREVYLPRAWTDDPDRRASAGVPAEVGFATKLTLARRMLTRALDAGAPAAWGRHLVRPWWVGGACTLGQAPRPALVSSTWDSNRVRACSASRLAVGPGLITSI